MPAGCSQMIQKGMASIARRYTLFSASVDVVRGQTVLKVWSRFLTRSGGFYRASAVITQDVTGIRCSPISVLVVRPPQYRNDSC